MRNAKAMDYWRECYKTKKYEYVIRELNFNGVYGLSKIDFKKGIFAICGLNGAGKSTIISFIKDIMGVKLDKLDLKKISDQVVTVKLFNDIREYKNCENCRLNDYTIEDTICSFVDYKSAIFNLNFFLENKNLDELLEQYEDNILLSEEVREISYVIGKDYSKCTIIEVDDDDIGHPFFKVNCSEVEYDSISMGAGEHFLFYIYWLINSMEKEKILIIEEPETFVSIKSQVNLMNYLAKVASQKGISIIISTHSPFILKNIPQENICIVNRYGNKADISYPMVREESINNLGLKLRKRGIIYIEDDVAKLVVTNLLMYSKAYFILKDYNFEAVNGEANITNRLKFPISKNFEYQIIGIYDGDMKEIINKQKDNIKCKYLFLPWDDGIEAIFKLLIRGKINDFCHLSSLPKKRVIKVLSSVDGSEQHDWLINLANELAIAKSQLIDILLKIWLSNDKQNQKLVNEFIENILKACDYK